MSTTSTSNEDHHDAARYEIRIKGHLDNCLASRFEGLTITLEADGETWLTSTVTDQSALHGLLRKVRDLGMPLISVKRIESGQIDESEIKS